MIVKVCGMRDVENISRISSLQIDWIGFIFYEKTPRYAGNLNPAIETGSLKRVGVFVNATHRQLIETAKTYRLDYLQLHGDESPEFCRMLHEQGFSLIKAFPVNSVADFDKTDDYEGCADFFLFDTKCGSYGGSGRQFDWTILSSYQGNTPFLLSGGITPESVEAINNLKHPLLAGIDLNSGFEIAPGLKDANKLSKLLDKVKIER